MPTLQIVNFNIVCAVLGGFITTFGLVSYLLKERFYLSEALLATIWGLIFSPHGTNWIRPFEYALQDEETLEYITLYFARLVLGVQLVLAGVQLPSKYLWQERKSLAILLGPGMTVMWVCTSMLVWALVPNINILMALSVGACVTPTDPILSNGIVKGKFADKNIPPPLQKIIVAESGANDGLGYPFLFLGLYLLKYVGQGGAGQSGGGGLAIGYWFGETWGYEILLSVVYGAVVGWVAKELLHFAEERRYVDRESFLVFAITLALFIVGTAGMFGSDDVLACFIAGNTFTWDDWFRQETMDDSLQPTIDFLLNIVIFMWFGAVCPWHSFVENSVIPIYRLIPLGILVLLFRRLPMLLAFHKFIHQVEDLKRAFFMGFFGPIGVSAIFYLYVSREFLRDIEVDGVQRSDAAQLAEVMNVVIWFLVVCSIVTHGLSIPVGKLGVHLPRTISTALSIERTSQANSRARSESPFARQARQDDDDRDATAGERALTREFRRRRPTSSDLGPRANDEDPDYPFHLAVMKRWWGYFTGGIPKHHKRAKDEGVHPTDIDGETGQVKNNGQSNTDSGRPGGPRGSVSGLQISAPRDPRIIGRPINKTATNDEGDRRSGSADSQADASTDHGIKIPEEAHSEEGTGTPTTPITVSTAWNRTIRFGDDTARPTRS